MRVVWKYPLEVRGGPQQLMIPKGGKIVHVASQNNVPTIWVELYNDMVDEERIFRVFGTGHAIDNLFWEYVGTVMMPPFIWHIYEWKVTE